MNPESCDQIAELIDLYAARECTRDEGEAVRAHVDHCDRCRESLEQSRELLGLVDLHFRQDEGMRRLAGRLKPETRPAVPPARTRPFVRRVAAVAALVLVTFGMGVWLPAGLPVKAAPVLQVALLAPDRGQERVQVPGHARGKDMLAKPAMELNIKNLPALEEAVKKAKDTGDWPEAPAVDVDVVVKNTAATAVRLDIGGPDFSCVIDLSDPSVVRQTLPPSAPVPFPPSTVTIPAGGSYTLHVDRLASQIGSRVQNLYPTKPGEYTLVVRLDAVARRQGVRQRIHLTAGAMTVRLR